MSYIALFSQLTKDDIPSAGGKGANLGEMTAVGFPVPPGYVVTTAAYDAFVQTHGLHQQIVDLARAASADDPKSAEDAAIQIKQLFLGAEVPENIAKDVIAANAALGDDPVAVRSSATAEDLPGASFAGQQETYLNIREEDSLLDAVKRCWASLWTARAIAYRERQEIDPAGVSLAVIVQQLIPADVSGILFTANPVNGQQNEILINAAWGLGEAIVSGQVTPDTVVVDKSTCSILSRDTAVKRTMTVHTETGTEEQAAPQTQQNQPALDDAAAIQLAQIGAAVEAHYCMPMDIEWAIVGGEIAILQARPITSLPDTKSAPLQEAVWEPILPNTIWMRRQIVEHMPEPLSPLFEDLYLRQGLDRSIGKLMEDMAEIGGASFDLDTMMPHGFAGTINGYAYTTGSFNMNGPNLVAILKIYGRLFRFFKMTAFDWEGVVLPEYQALIARWKAVDLAEATDEELLRGISEMAAADSGYWFGSALNLGLSRILDPVFDWFLKSPLIGGALPKPRPASATFLRGFDSRALDAQADMEALADRIRQSTALRALVLKTPADQLMAALAEHPEGQQALAAIERYLDEYGHQIYNLDFVDPTQNEDPLPMLLSLKALVDNPPEQAVRARQAEMAAARDAQIVEIERRLNPLSRKLFRWVWKWTKHYAPYRENVMFYMGAAWPTTRKLAHELGRRLVEASAITAPDELYYLDAAEIAAVIEARANGQPTPAFAQMAQERRALREARMQLTPPPKVPERGSLKFGPFDLSMFDPTPTDMTDEGPILNGYAVSTGSVTAPASVVRSIDEFDQMKPGTILVCTTTTPAWTPLFSQAAGLVTDVGGALAHGSIVAREYGIPAVMGTGVATERIQSGMMLVVDGDAGTVTLTDEVDPLATTAGQASPIAESKTGNNQKLLFAVATGTTFILLFWWKRRR